MNCPKCHSSTRIKGSREQSGLGVKRRRTCPDCGFDFLTISDSTHGEKYLGPAPKYTPEQKAEIGDRYIRLVKWAKAAPLTEAQKAQAQRALELVRLRLNINRVPVGMKEINRNNHLWVKK